MNGLNTSRGDFIPGGDGILSPGGALLFHAKSRRGRKIRGRICSAAPACGPRISPLTLPSLSFPSLPSPLCLLSPAVTPSPYLPLPSLPLEVGPLNPARGSVSSPSGVWGRGVQSPSRNRICCILPLTSLAVIPSVTRGASSVLKLVSPSPALGKLGHLHLLTRCGVSVINVCVC